MTPERRIIAALLAVARAAMTTSGHLSAPGLEGEGRCVRSYHAAIVDGRHVQIGRCCRLCQQAVDAIASAESWLLEHSAKQLELIS